MDDATRVVRVCSRCGRELPADAPQCLCASCLFEIGVETVTPAAAVAGGTMGSGPQSTLQPFSADQQLAPGQTWGNYRIGRLLGRGGMGEVYEAEQTSSGRRVALKVLRGQLQDAGERAR